MTARMDARYIVIGAVALMLTDWSRKVDNCAAFVDRERVYFSSD
jgi:hypothetical protein